MIFRVHRTFSLRPAVGVVFDPMVRETLVASNAFSAAPSRTRTSWAVATRLGAFYAVLPRFDVFVEGGAEFVLNRFDYVLAPAQGDGLLSPLSVRPGFLVGGAWGFP